MVSLVFRCVCFVARLLVTCDLLFRADCLLAFVVYFCVCVILLFFGVMVLCFACEGLAAFGCVIVNSVVVFV